jgi:CheY-specific phosphatase CheX
MIDGPLQQTPIRSNYEQWTSFVRRQIEAVVSACCVELFSHYGVSVEPTDDAAQANLVFCAAIGFTGKHLRGSLLLAASPEPLELAGDDSRRLRDWLAELTNQMIGRVKSRLIACGTSIYYSTPIVLRGEHLAPLADQPVPLLFAVNRGVVSIWFDVEIAPDLVLHACNVETPGREGQALLF